MARYSSFLHQVDIRLSKVDSADPSPIRTTECFYDNDPADRSGKQVSRINRPFTSESHGGR